jgi:hypothetical protein
MEEVENMKDVGSQDVTLGSAACRNCKVLIGVKGVMVSDHVPMDGPVLVLLARFGKEMGRPRLLRCTSRAEHLGNRSVCHSDVENLNLAGCQCCSFASHW